MLLLLTALSGAWAQDAPAEEPAAPEAPAAAEGDGEEPPPAEAPAAEGEAGATEPPEGESAEGDAAEAPSAPEAPAEPAAAPEPPPVAPPADVTPVPLSLPPTTPELIQHLAEHSTPYGLVQVWGIGWDQDQTAQADAAGFGDPEDDIGFKIRRARLGVEGDWGTVGYRVGVGYSSGFDGIDTRSGLEIIDASVDYQVHRHLGLRAGVTKVPFGRDNAISSSDLALGERAIISNHVTPDRDVGVVLDGGNKGVRIQAGLFNGNASLAGDENPGVMAVTRISYDRGPANMLQTFGTAESLSFSVGGNVAYNWDTATSELMFGVDLGLRVSSLTVLLDIQAGRITPTNTTVDQPGVLQPTVHDGAVLHIGYTLKDTWEPVVRVEWYDDDPSAEGDELAMVSLGFAAHLAEDRVQTGLAFVHRQEVEGPTIANDTLRGFVQVAW